MTEEVGEKTEGGMVGEGGLEIMTRGEKEGMMRGRIGRGRGTEGGGTRMKGEVDTRDMKEGDMKVVVDGTRMITGVGGRRRLL